MKTAPVPFGRYFCASACRGWSPGRHGTPSHRRMFLKPLGHRQRVGALALASQRQGLDAQQRQPGVEGVWLGPRSRSVTAWPYMVKPGRRRSRRRSARDSPAPAATGSGTCRSASSRTCRNRSTTPPTAVPLPDRNLVVEWTTRSAPIDGLAQIGCGQRVVDDQRDAGLMGDGRDGFDIDHHAARDWPGSPGRSPWSSADGPAEILRHRPDRRRSTFQSNFLKALPNWLIDPP